MMPTAVKVQTVTYILAVIKLLIPFLLISPVFELQRDEFLYYEQGMHPDLGYLENPPLLSYFTIISSILGGGEWTVKLIPALFGALTVLVACKITALLGGKGFAQFLTGFAIITGAYLRIHVLFQPNVLDILFWTCSLYFLLCYIQTRDTDHFFWMTLSLALGWWSKYSIVFLAAAIFLALMLTYHRRIFYQRKVYTSLLAGLLIVSPNIYWQYLHNWPLVHHMKELRETQLVFINPADFIKDQFLMLIPVIFVWIAGLIWLFRKKEYRVFGWIFLAVITLLILGSGKSYYSLGVYPILIAAGSVYWEKISVTRKWLRYVSVLFVLAVTLLFLPIAVPFMKPEKLSAFYSKYGVGKSGLLKWEDQQDHDLPQDFADMLGWKELADKSEKFYMNLPDSVRQHTIIFGRHYGHAGGIRFYAKNHEFRSKVFTDNGSFLLWIPGNLSFRHILLIARRLPEKDDEVFQHFEKVTIADSVSNRFSRQFGDKIIFYENIDPKGKRLATQGLKEMKAVFNR